MKTIRLAFLQTLLLASAICGFSQVTLVEYTFTGETRSAQTVHPNTTATDFTASSGNITFGSVAGGWSGSGTPYAQAVSGWDEPTSSTAKFLSFTVTADPFSLININNLSFLYRATVRGPDSIAVIAETDTLFYDAFSSGNTISLSETVNLTNMQSVQIKILGWGDTESGGGAFRIDDVELTGSITPLVQMIDFDEETFWIRGSTNLSNYAIDHQYIDKGFVFTGGPALRKNENDTINDFFATYQNSPHSWQLRVNNSVVWDATLTLPGEIQSFGFQTRRFDAGGNSILWFPNTPI